MKKLMLRIFLFVVRLLVLFGVLVMLFRLGNYAYHFGYQLYSSKGVEESPGTDLAIVIYEEQTVEEIADMLERFGLIQNKRVFIIQERLFKYHGEIIPGNYVLNTSMSGNDMLMILTGHDKDTDESEENG